MADHYEVLGLPKSASDADVRRAYKKAALRWHPDKNPADRARAETMFKRAAEAYRVLVDPQRRAEYDRASAAPRLASGRPPPPPASGPGQAVVRGAPATFASRAASSSSKEMDEAWSLFEEFFGGRDPFEHFDALFEDPSSADFDRVFETLGMGTRKPPTAMPAGGIFATARTAKGPGASAGQAPSLQTSRSASAHQGWASAAPARRRVMVRCVGQHGVAWRRSMSLSDRSELARGPEYGDIITAEGVQGEWIYARDGWLPLTINGARVFEFLDGSQTWSVRCLSSQGVAYRRSMSMDDRVEGVRGPEHGAVLPIEELRGGWVHTASGWLPLAINGTQVFELCQGARPGWSGSVGQQQQQEEEQVEPAGSRGGGAPWGGWSMLLPGLPYGLLTVVGAGGYVALKAARLLFRAWWNTWFGLLPYLFRG